MLVWRFPLTSSEQVPMRKLLSALFFTTVIGSAAVQAQTYRTCKKAWDASCRGCRETSKGMTAVVMIGTSVMIGVAMGFAMTIVGATIAASVMPTGVEMIAGMTIAAGMIGASAMATGGAMLAISETTIDAANDNRCGLDARGRGGERGHLLAAVCKAPRPP
jgi:hypothetical protein